jgi:hypothetical protein
MQSKDKLHNMTDIVVEQLNEVRGRQNAGSHMSVHHTKG